MNAAKKKQYRIKEIATGELKHYIVQKAIDCLFFTYWSTAMGSSYGGGYDLTFESIDSAKAYIQGKKNQPIVTKKVVFYN